MGIDHTTSSMQWAAETQKRLYEDSQENSRYFGIAYGLCSSIISTAGRIGHIAETIIKGLINILGSPFLDECECLKGLKQIFIQLPVSIVCLIFIPFSITGNIISDTIGMLIDPEDYSTFRRDLHARELSELEGIIELFDGVPNTLLTKAAHLCFR